MPERRRLWLCVGLLAAALLVLLPARPTGAAWTDSATIVGTDVETGVLDVEVDGQDGIVGLDALDRLGLLPGDQVSSTITVSNAGSTPLHYSLTAAGTDADGLHLADVLDVTWRSADCASELPGAPRELAAGGTERICLRVALPSAAPAAVAGGATDLAFTVHAADGAWTDQVPITGTSLSAVSLTRPSVTCGAAALASITVEWAAVPGATGYRIDYGTDGLMTTTVGPEVLSRSFMLTSGLVSVRALFGDSWESAPSEPLLYSALAASLGSCG